MPTPTIKHWIALGQILCYLKEALSHDILYNNHKHTHIEYFAYVGWVGSKIGRRFTIDYYIFVGENFVLMSTKQNIVS